MAIESKLIRVRRGTNAEFEAGKSKIISGEFAVVTDAEEAYFSPQDGKSVRLATEKDVSQLEESIADKSELEKKVDKPTDTDGKPVNGTSGQALLTNGDGTTCWGDVTSAIVEEAKGQSILLTDSDKAKFRGLNVYGKTTQKTTTGKNLLENTATTQTVHGVTFTVNEDGSITINGTATAQADFNIIGTWDSADNILDIGKEYIITGTNDAKIRIYGAYNSANLFSLTSGEAEKTYINNTGLSCVYISVASGTTVSNKTVYPMIRLASIADSNYEPYTGGIASPNPEYPQELNSVGNDGVVDVGVHGGNLLNLPNIEPFTLSGITWSCKDGVVTATGTTTVVNSSQGLNIYYDFPILKGTYYISGSVGNLQVIAAVRDSEGAIRYHSEKSFTLDGTEQRCGIYCHIPANSTVDTSVYPMLNVGSAKMTYESYTKQSLSISVPTGLPGIAVTDASLATYTDENGQMWCADEIDYERRKYVQRVAKTQLLSSYASWAKTGTNVDRYYCSIAALKGIDTALYNHILCTHFVTSSEGETIGEIKANSGSIGFAFSEKNGSTLDEFKAFLDVNEVYVWYILASPIETDLSSEEIEAYKALHTNYTSTTILNNEGAYMKSKYVADTKTYIDNKFAELQVMIANNV